MGIKNTIEGIKIRLKGINPTIEILSEDYVKNSAKLHAHCLVCGNNWFAIWNNLLRGVGCPKCARERISKSRVIPTSTKISNFYDKIKDIKILHSGEIYTTSKIRFQCIICLHEWVTAWSHVERGNTGCPNCNKGVRRDVDDVRKEILEINQKIQPLFSDEDYKNSNSKLLVKCLVDGHEWTVDAQQIKRGALCPKCENKIEYNINTIQEIITESGRNLKILSNEYVNNHQYLDIECLDCNLIFSKKWMHLKRGQSCPNCYQHKGWGFNQWVNKSLKNNTHPTYKLYYIKIFNDHEIFYKIGITYTSLKYRFREISKIYNIEVIEVIESEDPKYIWDLEVELKRKNKPNRYTPKQIFGGHSECFSFVNM